MREVNGARVLSLLVVGLTTGIAVAVWSDDLYENVLVSDRPYFHDDVKIAAGPDGRCYISWINDLSSTGPEGFDVYLQHLSAVGDVLWPLAGLCVADRALSWYEEYGLAVDRHGHALVAFENRSPARNWITVVKVTPDGTLPWGAGLEVASSSTDSLDLALVAAPTNGGAVVAWCVDMHTIHLQRFDAAGRPQWQPEVVLRDPQDAHFMLSDLRAADNGSVVLAWVRSTDNLCDPRQLWAQKLGPAGNTLWDPQHVVVFDGGALPLAHFPRIVPDARGGAALAWCDIAGGTRQVRAQWLLPIGAPWFAPNGVLVSTTYVQCDNPSVCVNSETADVFVFWEQDLPGTQRQAVYGQRLALERSVRQWGEEGREIIPAGYLSAASVYGVTYADGALVHCLRGAPAVGYHVEACRVDRDGEPVWTPAILTASAVDSSKGSLYVSPGPRYTSLLAWVDSRSTPPGIYAQNVNPDGTLGLRVPGDLNGDGGVTPADFALLAVCVQGPDRPDAMPAVDPFTFALADFDLDGDVDMSDCAAFQTVVAER